MEMNFFAPSLLEMKLGLHTTHLKPKGRGGEGGGGDVDEGVGGETTSRKA